jgi:hypothetical protein
MIPQPRIVKVTMSVLSIVRRFLLSDQQKEQALRVIGEVEKAKKWSGNIVTQVVPAGEFFAAETIIQDYLQKNPGGYTCHYLRISLVVSLIILIDRPLGGDGSSASLIS